MAKPFNVVTVAVILLSALAVVPVLRAHEPEAERHKRPMSGMDMMKGGMMGGGEMNQMMDHCAQMMSGGSTAPNEQWRGQAPAAPEKKQ